MYINQRWDYETMSSCATRLDSLRDDSNANKSAMDSAMETLSAGVQAETGQAFLSAYQEHVSSIELFAQILNSEAELLRNNSNAMQQADRDIAAEIRRIFSVG